VQGPRKHETTTFHHTQGNRRVFRIGDGADLRKQLLSITRKEIEGYFGSAMALIFVGAFLAVTLFSFFWVDTFFARGIADARPLFRWMPLLMIFLVAALTMRQWSWS
jgi:hypothetical protein